MITVTDHEVSELRRAYGLDDLALSRVTALGVAIRPQMKRYIDGFYDWMATQPVYEQYFYDPNTLERVKRLQLKYWEEFFAGRVDAHNEQRRHVVGETHARIGLPLAAYMPGMHVCMSLMLDELKATSSDPAAYADQCRAAASLMHLDTAVVVQTYTRLVNESIAAQGRALLEMSTPVTQVWEGVLMLPLVGLIDSVRARDVMGTMLQKIQHTRARVFIMDIGGVAVVDTAVANHLIKMTKATRLMGCECVISGVSPAIAETMVELGIDVGKVRTTGTLMDAIADAFQRMGLSIAHKA